MNSVYFRMNKTLSIFFLLSCLIIAISCDQKESKKTSSVNPYEEFISSMHKRGQFNGNVMVVKDGENVYQGSYGIKNINSSEKLDSDDRFRLASVSKQFTASAIIQLEEKGLLSYDQDIRDFIPELPYDGITVRNLLNHVSGLPDYESLMNEYWKPELKYDDVDRFVKSNQDIIDMLVLKKPDIEFSPEEKWQYSNTGYLLLATIVSEASGVPFKQYLKENIFEPAGMGSVVYDYMPEPDPDMPERVFGYRIALNGDKISDDRHFLNRVEGDGGIYASLEDLRKWDRALYTGKIISDKSKDKAFTPFVLKNGDRTEYGFGWLLGESPTGKRVVAHGGGWVGFRTFIYREIDENNCIIILTNNSNQYLRETVEGLKNILHDKAYIIPKKSIADTVAKIVLQKDLKQGIDTYKYLRERDSLNYDFSENQLNRLGYGLMDEEKYDEALGILDFNNKLFSSSANTYDSLGDAYLSKGDTINALMNFELAFKMDSTMTYSKNKAERLKTQ